MVHVVLQMYAVGQMHMVQKVVNAGTVAILEMAANITKAFTLN